MTYILNDKIINAFYKTILIYCENKNYYVSVKGQKDRDKLLSLKNLHLFTILILYWSFYANMFHFWPNILTYLSKRWYKNLPSTAL